jgi:exosortase
LIRDKNLAFFKVDKGQAVIELPSVKRSPLLAIPILLGVVGWLYWQTFLGLSEVWTRDPQYSHGFIVPLFAVAILVLRKKMLLDMEPAPSWWAVPALVLGAAMYLVGGFYFSPWLVQNSLLPVLAGVVLALGGTPFLRWSWPGILFLLFMMPLPYRVDHALVSPLQRIATRASTNALQTFGIFAQAEGNIIVLPDGYELGIVEACSGLRMLVVFVATSVAVAMVSHRSMKQRILIVLSSLPIAIFCNVVRITATGILHETAGHEAANYLFHDLAGWLMAPLAMILLCGELWVLGRAWVPEQAGPTPIAMQKRSISALSRVGADQAGSIR